MDSRNGRLRIPVICISFSSLPPYYLLACFSPLCVFYMPNVHCIMSLMINNWLHLLSCYHPSSSFIMSKSLRTIALRCLSASISSCVNVTLTFFASHSGIPICNVLHSRSAEFTLMSVTMPVSANLGKSTILVRCPESEAQRLQVVSEMRDEQHRPRCTHRQPDLF